jgi:sulfhydrogenase subunit alpha
MLGGNRTYLVGPMARYSLSSGHLPEAAAGGAHAVELVYACDEALRLIEHYEPPDPPSVDVPPSAATGYGCTEAPRGLIYHRYSQNQRVIKTDLREFAGPRLDVPHDRLTWECEQAVRNHDPCISCSAHFLDVRVPNRAGLCATSRTRYHRVTSHRLADPFLRQLPAFRHDSARSPS